MPQIFSRGDSVYQCDVCNRKTRIPTNSAGLDVIQRCIITNNCPGKLHRVILRKDINNTPATPPKVSGVEDWYQRRVLFNYTQGIESIQWKIAHELGSVPSLQVFVNKDTSDGKISVETTEYQVTVVDSNNLTVTFPYPQSGTIQCIAFASQNTTNPQQPDTPAVVADVPISNSGIITIATIINGTGLVYPINIRATFKNPVTGESTVTTYESVDDIPDAASPWAGTSKIYATGNTYAVRTFNVMYPTTQVGQLVTGSPATIEIDMAGGYQYITTYKTHLILLGAPPYKVPDRITDKYIDIASLSLTLPEIYYSAGDILCTNKMVKSTYPPIIGVE